MKSTNITRFLLLGASLALIALGNGASLQQTAGELFEKALYVEEGQGDLPKAIGLYQDIVKGFPENRDVAAKALLHIGLCYEKLGSQEALKTYQRLIADYPGQKEEVALAKERMARLSRTAEPAMWKPKFRKIQTPFRIPQWSGGCLSPDGKTLAFGSQDFLWTVPIPGKVDPDLAGEPNKLPGTTRHSGSRPDLVLRWPLDRFQPGLSPGRRRIYQVQPRGSLCKCHPLIGRGAKKDSHSSVGYHAGSDVPRTLFVAGRKDCRL